MHRVALHDAVWAASVGAPGANAVSIPIFVDGRTFAICPGAGHLGETPIGIGLQLGLVSNSGIDRPLVTAPTTPGRFVWSATLTWPGQADARLLNIASVPQRAAFRAKVVHGRVRIRGRVVADGQGIPNVRVAAFVNGAGRHLIINGPAERTAASRSAIASVAALSPCASTPTRSSAMSRRTNAGETLALPRPK